MQYISPLFFRCFFPFNFYSGRFYRKVQILHRKDPNPAPKDSNPALIYACVVLPLKPA